MGVRIQVTHRGEAGTWPQSQALTFAATLLLKILSVCTVAGILVWRGADRVWYPQFWAEDGTIFFQDAYNLSFWRSVTSPYKGYYHLIVRVLAEIALLFRIELVPGLFVLFALGIAVLCCSFFLLDAFAWIVPAVRHRALFCLLLAALPANHEILLRFVNIQWYLGLLCFLLVMMRIPVHTLGKVLYVLGWLLIAATAPQTVIFIPCLFIRAWLDLEDRAIVLTAGAAVCAVVALVAWERIAHPLVETRVELQGSLALALINAVALRVLVVATVSYGQAFQMFNGSPGYYAYLWYIPYALLNFLILYALIKQHQSRQLVLWSYITYCIFVPIILALLGRPEFALKAQQMGNLWNDERYFVLPITALYFGGFWCATVLYPKKAIWNTLAKSLLVILVLAAIIPDFFPTRSDDKQWYTQAQRIKAAELSVSPVKLIIPINPSSEWDIVLSPRPAYLPAFDALIPISATLQGGFEAVTNEAGTSATVPQNRIAKAQGWALNLAADGAAQEVVVIDPRAHMVLARTRPGVARADVAAAKGERLLRTGWEVSFPIDMLDKGTHTLRAYVFDQQTMQILAIPGEVTLQVDSPDQ